VVHHLEIVSDKKSCQAELVEAGLKNNSIIYSPGFDKLSLTVLQTDTIPKKQNKL